MVLNPTPRAIPVAGAQVPVAVSRSIEAEANRSRDSQRHADERRQRWGRVQRDARSRRDECRARELRAAGGTLSSSGRADRHHAMGSPSRNGIARREEPSRVAGLNPRDGGGKRRCADGGRREDECGRERVADDGTGDRLAHLDRRVGRLAQVARDDRGATDIHGKHGRGVAKPAGERGVAEERDEGALLPQRDVRHDGEHNRGDDHRRHELDERETPTPSRGGTVQHRTRVRRITTCDAGTPNATLSLTPRVCPASCDDQVSVRPAVPDAPDVVAQGEARSCSRRVAAA